MGINISCNNTNLYVNEKVTVCPICHFSIDVRYVAFRSVRSQQYECIMQCPRAECESHFIAYYKYEAATNGAYNYKLLRVAPRKAIFKSFPSEITEVSPPFTTIYNQAAEAEATELNEICGVGYRKALEFLIKDYVISVLGDDAEEIEKIKKNPSIYNVIMTYVGNENIKSTAKRAVWLGNDETHYTRKWTDKQIDDLKLLIELTTHWISLESITRNYEKSMPDN